MKAEIKICMGSSCFARGNDKNLEYIENFIKENNLDAQLELYGARCENLCSDGPSIVINEKRYEKVTIEKLKTILEGLINEQSISNLHS